MKKMCIQQSEGRFIVPCYAFKLIYSNFYDVEGTNPVVLDRVTLICRNYSPLFIILSAIVITFNKSSYTSIYVIV